jgi:hypothetical protein
MAKSSPSENEGEDAVEVVVVGGISKDHSRVWPTK